MAVVVCLPYLPVRNFRKFQSSQLERYARSDVKRFGIQRLTVDDVFIFDIGRKSGFDYDQLPSLEKYLL